MLLIALLATTSAGHAEPIPIDEKMAEFELEYPQIRKGMASVMDDVSRLGPEEEGWASSGLGVADVIALESVAVSDVVLGEWEVGGHGVSSPDPLGASQDAQRYVVREYVGRTDYHTYHRLAGLPDDVTIHTFGTVARVGNAECQGVEGIELISSKPWRQWSSDTVMTAFAVARATRDDPHKYCIIYRSAGAGRYLQLAYTSGGQPYLLANEKPQAFVATPRSEAAARIFARAEMAKE